MTKYLSLLVVLFLSILILTSSLLSPPNVRSSVILSSPSTWKNSGTTLRKPPSVISPSPISLATFASKDEIPSTLPTEKESLFSLRRISYFLLWTGLFAYANYFTTSVNVDEEVANKVLNTAIFTPFDGTLSPIFITIFLFLGILPTVYGSLLLPAAKQQKVWCLPFVGCSFALGFFGIGPYLLLREKSPTTQPLTIEDRDTGAGLLEFKGTPFFLLFSAIYLVYFALTGDYVGGVASSSLDRWQGYVDLFNTQPLVRISTIDFTILTLAMWDPLEEDMRRRGYQGPDAKVFCALPVIGPVLYLLLRPTIPNGTDAT